MEEISSGLSSVVNHFKRPQFAIFLNGWIVEFPSDEPLGVEDGVGRIHRRLVLGSVADEALRVRKGDVRGRRPVTLIVGDDLHFAVLKDAHAGVGRPQIDSDRG